MSAASDAFVSLVASQVRAEMARQRRTGADLARVLGMSQSTASTRLTGKTPFYVAELQAIAEWLGVSVVTLVERAESVSA